MAKAKKINVKALTTFFDKAESKRRNKGDCFGVTDKRLNEIQKYEKSNNLKLIEVVKNDKSAQDNADEMIEESEAKENAADKTE